MNLLQFLIGVAYFGAVVAIDSLSVMQRMPHVMPSGWARARPARTSRLHSLPTGYITLERREGDQCSGPATFVMGMGVGVCMVGLDSNNTEVGSIIYNNAEITDGILTFYSSAFTSLDCSGAAVANDKAVIPTSCMPSDDATLSYIYSYTEKPQSWTDLDKGIVFQ